MLIETVAARGGTVNAVTARIDNPAEVIAAAHRHFVRLARRDPEWAWLVVRGNLSHDVVLAALGPSAERDIRRGVQCGRLSVGDERAALYGAGGALLGVMRAILDGQAPADADVHHAEGVLRLLGLTVTDAAEVARRPLPPRPLSIQSQLTISSVLCYCLAYETSNDPRRPDRRRHGPRSLGPPAR